MSQEPCRAELATRGRRGMLTDFGHRALDAHLAGCPSCRLDQQVFADFDQDSAVDIRDGGRIESLSAVARVWAKGRQSGGAPGRGRRVSTWAAAAAMLLLAGVAGAATWWMGRETLSPAKSGAGEARAPRMTPRLSPPVPPQPAAPVVVEPVELPRGLERTRPLQRQARAARELTAASLLRQAGEARRAADTEQALGLYRRLQNEFPTSAEALLSQVPLGNLHLDRGRAAEALVELERYLDTRPGGVLVAEALYGRARALAALGKRAESRLAWQRLLQEFPSSAYAPLARRRIAESQ